MVLRFERALLRLSKQCREGHQVTGFLDIYMDVFFCNYHFPTHIPLEHCLQNIFILHLSSHLSFSRLAGPSSPHSDIAAKLSCLTIIFCCWLAGAITCYFLPSTVNPPGQPIMEQSVMKDDSTQTSFEDLQLRQREGNPRQRPSAEEITTDEQIVRRLMEEWKNPRQIEREVNLI